MINFSLFSFIAIFLFVLTVMLCISGMVLRGGVRVAGYAFAVPASLTAASMLSSGWLWNMFSIIAILVVFLFLIIFLMLTINWARYRLQVFRLQTNLARNYSRRIPDRIFRYNPRTNQLDEIEE